MCVCHYLPDDDTWPQVEVLVDNAQQLSLWLIRRAVCEQGDGEGVGHADGIGHLQDKAQARLNHHNSFVLNIVTFGLFVY